MKQNRKLSESQARYVAARIAGLAPRPAYKQAFPDAGAVTLKCKPYILEKHPGVKAAIEAGVKKDTFSMAKLMQASGVKAAIAAGVITQEVAEVGLSRAEKRRILKRIATDKNAARIDRMRAIQIDNLMTGDNKPVRFEGEVTLHTIFQALTGTTGLPADGELIELDPKMTAALPP